MAYFSAVSTQHQALFTSHQTQISQALFYLVVVIKLIMTDEGTWWAPLEAFYILVSWSEELDAWVAVNMVRECISKDT